LSRCTSWNAHSFCTGNNWVLTRASYYDTVADINAGDFVLVNLGTVNTGTGWIETATVATIGTDAISFSLFGAGAYALKGANADITSMSGLTGGISTPTFITMANGGSLRTNTSAGNTLLLQAYDVNGASYTTFGTLTANNTPTFDLDAAVTIATLPIAMGGANSNITSMTGLTGTLKYPTGIVDSNDNLIMQFSFLASAVNYWRFYNNATGSGPIVQTQGTDAAIPFVFQTKNSDFWIQDATNTIAPTLRLYNAAATHYTGLKVATAAATDVTFVLPSADGIKGQQIVTDGSANLSLGGAINTAKNIVIGGDFSLNPWQRGTSFAAIATTTYCADRFRTGFSTSAVVTISKSADAPTVSEAGIFTQHCLLIDCTTADGSVAAGDYFTLQYVIEGYDFTRIAQRQFTMSFWHKHTKTGTYCIGFSNGVDRTYIAEYTQSVTDTWEYSSITVTASPSAGTWVYGNTGALYIYFTLMSGSTFQTTANTWQTGSYIATANQVNALDDTANNCRFALVQIEAGTVATPFEIETAQQTLAKCQRYYYKTFPQGTAPAQNTGSQLGSVTYTVTNTGVVTKGLPIRFPVTMRVAPTLTFYSTNASATTWYNASDAGNSGASGVVNTGDSGVMVYNLQVAGDGAGESVCIHYSATAEI